MAITISCNVASAQTSIFSGLVERLVVRGDIGDIGVEHGHAPLLTSIIPGPIRIKLASGEESIFFVSGGFLEVQPGEVNVLADSVIRAEDIDEAVAIQAKKEAEQLIQEHKTDFDYALAQSQLLDAIAQLRTLDA